MMKRIFAGGVGLALLLGAAGCSDSQMEPGMPKGDLKPQAEPDPKIMDMSGRSFTDQKKAAAKAAESAKGAPAEEKK